MVKTQWMLIAGGRIYCRQCQAVSKRSKLQCKAPAKRGQNVCRTHGGESSGPVTERGRAKCAAAKIVHGKDTRAKRAQNAISTTKLLLLRDLGVKLGMFGDQLTGWPGRRPRGYPITELMSVEELMEEIGKLE